MTYFNNSIFRRMKGKAGNPDMYQQKICLKFWHFHYATRKLIRYLIRNRIVI